MALSILCFIAVNVLGEEREHDESLKSDTKKRLFEIGSTRIPIKVKEDDIAECKIPLAMGLIHLLENEEVNRPYKKEFVYSIVTVLIKAGCIDKDVISGIISYGLNFCSTHGNLQSPCSKGMENFMYVVLIRMPGQSEINWIQVQDDRFVFAVQVGLFEL